MSKELYIAAHEELIDEYLEAHPGADWSEAYERTADRAHDRMVDWIAAEIDAAKDRAIEQRDRWKTYSSRLRAGKKSNGVSQNAQRERKERDERDTCHDAGTVGDGAD